MGSSPTGLVFIAWQVSSAWGLRTLNLWLGLGGPSLRLWGEFPQERIQRFQKKLRLVKHYQFTETYGWLESPKERDFISKKQMGWSLGPVIQIDLRAAGWMALWPEGLEENTVEEQNILIERMLAGSWETRVQFLWRTRHMAVLVTTWPCSF